VQAVYSPQAQGRRAFLTAVLRSPAAGVRVVEVAIALPSRLAHLARQTPQDKGCRNMCAVLHRCIHRCSGGDTDRHRRTRQPET
jgi:hypothetical protein